METTRERGGDMKYAVIIHCVYDGSVEQRYERCIIRPADLEDERNDGMNYVVGAGRETFDFYVVSGLEEAILSTHFNPEAIEFLGLSEDEIARKDAIVSKYGFDPVNGVYEKTL